MTDSESTPMPFTGHTSKEIRSTLVQIVKCGMPIEVFDAFLAEYARSKDLNKSMKFAFDEWDC